MKAYRLSILFIILFIAGCGGDPESPESKIRHIIEQMSDAAEARSLKDLVAPIAKSYKDKYHPNKAAAAKSLLGYFHQHRQIYLLTQIKLIDVKADRAKAIVYVAMAGVPIESTQALLSVKADLYRFDLDFTEIDDDWQLTSAEWARAHMSHFGS